MFKEDKPPWGTLIIGQNVWNKSAIKHEKPCLMRVSKLWPFSTKVSLINHHDE